MLREQLSPALEALISSLQFREANHPVDAGGKILGEGRVGDDVLDSALRIRGDETNAERRRGIEGMRDADFSGFQTVLVHDVLLGGKDEPNGFVVKRCVFFIFVIISNQGLLSRILFLFFLLRLDVSQKCRRSSGNLYRKKKRVKKLK